MWNGMSSTIENKFKVDSSNQEIQLVRGRLAFHSSTQQKVAIRFGQARCHSFSQDFIAAILHQIVVSAIYCRNSRDANGARLLCLGSMVFGAQASGEKNNYETVMGQFLEQSASVFAGSAMLRNQLLEAVKTANSLMHQLNNSLYNLRPGDKAWNSSISYDFDPTAWAYVADIQGRKYYIDHTSLQWQKETLGRPAGIHLTDAGDAQRMLHYCELRGMLESDYVFGIDIYSCKVEGVSCLFAGSSSNRFKKPPGCVPGKCSQIYIEDNGNWISIA